MFCRMAGNRSISLLIDLVKFVVKVSGFPVFLVYFAIGGREMLTKYSFDTIFLIHSLILYRFHIRPFHRSLISV